MKIPTRFLHFLHSGNIPFFCGVLSALLFAGVNKSQAEDFHWDPTKVSGSLNSDTNWVEGAYPGDADHVLFSNNDWTTLRLEESDLTTKAATFKNTEDTNGSYNLNLGSGNTWNVTDTFDVHLKKDGMIYFDSGTINVTNAEGTATATFGSYDPDTSEKTYGSLCMDNNDAVFIVDKLYVKGTEDNANAGLILKGGRLDILHGSQFDMDGQTWLTIGDQRKTASFNFLGGTHTINLNGRNMTIGGNGKGTVVVFGSGTTLKIVRETGSEAVYIGQSAASEGSSLTVENGAKMELANVALGVGQIFNESIKNKAEVTGVGSKLTISNNSLVIGIGNDHTLTVSDGGEVDVIGGNIYVGENQGNPDFGWNNVLTVTGAGSILRLWDPEDAENPEEQTFFLYSGLRPNTKGNVIEAVHGGVIQANRMRTRYDVTNMIRATDGGVFQFTTRSPDLLASDDDAGGAITLGEGGVVSFLEIDDAPLDPVEGLVYTGTVHGLRLDSAKNERVGDYTFSTSGTYSRLELMHGGTWQSGTWQAAHAPTTLIIGNGGELMGEGTIQGAVKVESGGVLAMGHGLGTMIFEGNLTLAPGSVSNFEINGWTNGLHDLASSGNGMQMVSFHGTLNLIFDEGFHTVGTVKIFHFESYTGSFDAVHTTGLAEGYAASFDASKGTVTVVAKP